MFENPRRGRQARNFTTSVSKILDLKSSSEQIFFRKLSLGAPESTSRMRVSESRAYPVFNQSSGGFIYICPLGFFLLPAVKEKQ